ncbi:SNARE-associated protein Snapin-like [Diadema antillarum]|uniref:SNARE-associated protein Snapin-like n=1 Tax=Diadema antillarum TaxID=105358 RepID=UPI003A8BEED4
MENRDAIASGIAELLKPAVQEVDERVRIVRESQVELRHRIEELDDALRELCKEKSAPIDLDLYVKKLANCKRRVATVNNIVQNAQDRVLKLDARVNSTTVKRYRFMERLRSQLSHDPASEARETPEAGAGGGEDEGEGETERESSAVGEAEPVAMQPGATRDE